MDVMIQKKTPTGTIRWNVSLYQRIYSARKDKQSVKEISKPDLVGKPVPGKEGFVYQSFYLHWYAGWYVWAVFVNSENSHGAHALENINSICDYLFEGR